MKIGCTGMYGRFFRENVCVARLVGNGFSNNNDDIQLRSTQGKKVMLTRPLICMTISSLLIGCAGAPPLPEPEPHEYQLEASLSVPTNGAIFNAYNGIAFLEDRRAKRVGDILIVVLAERTDAKKASDTNVSKNSTSTITDPVLAGRTRTIGNASNLGFSLDTDHAFAGGSDSSQSNQLQGTLAVTVTGVLPGGNLVIEGEKWVTINRGKEFIRVRGVVRPSDIAADNSIASTIIANAEIAYSGKGETADSNRMGWLNRFFLGPVWPF